MKRIFYIIILTFILTPVFCQERLIENLKYIEGIWIAEDYLKSFDENGSAIKSKPAFDPSDPVGLRINSTEVENNYLNIGFSTLHDHMIRPEVSKYYIDQGDTINEQGHFFVNVINSDSLNYYKTSEIYYFNDNSKSFLTWSYGKDTLLILYRPRTGDLPEKTIRYKRICKTFSKDYMYPNPIYYYTRSRTLYGTYVLRDSLNQIISNNFQIDLNGQSKGYEKFSNKYFYFSTDIYCGPESFFDFVVICSHIEKYDYDCDGYIYKRVNKKTIQLYRSDWETSKDGVDIQKTGKMIYELEKK